MDDVDGPKISDTINYKIFNSPFESVQLAKTYPYELFDPIA